MTNFRFVVNYASIIVETLSELIMRITVTCPHCGQKHVVDVDREMIDAQAKNEQLFEGRGGGDGELLVVSGVVSRATRVTSE